MFAKLARKFNLKFVLRAFNETKMKKLFQPRKFKEPRNSLFMFVEKCWKIVTIALSEQITFSRVEA